MVRPLAERLRKDGLKVWFDEWEIAKVEGAKRKSASEHQPSALSLQPFLGLSANAFGSDWAQLEAGTCGRGNLPFRDPLNQERRFIPLSLDDTRRACFWNCLGTCGQPRIQRHSRI